MRSIWRVLAILFILGAASAAWLVLGGIVSQRSGEQDRKLRGQVTELWGNPQDQAAPTLTFSYPVTRAVERTERPSSGGPERTIREIVTEHPRLPVLPSATRVAVKLHLDERLRGLVFYALYDVDFEGTWTYTHREAQAGTLRLSFAFPDRQAIYDRFRFVIDGKDQARRLRPQDGRIEEEVEVRPGQQVTLTVGYLSRGLDRWAYQPSAGVANLEDFQLRLVTDFAAIDYPPGSMSPSRRVQRPDGWELAWEFQQVLTGRQLGMLMPRHLQPGDLAAALSFSAPISLLFFFLLLMVLSRLKGLDIHPINYLFLAGAFFAFHLLFAYSVDHLHVLWAFALSSAVSLGLVVSYLRLVVSARFACVEAALGQLVYLVGFSAAHFFDGYTGLTVTCLSILTLFVMMQLTGRIRWGYSPSGSTRAAGTSA